MPTSTITSKNQTTIPKEVCQALHLQPGDKLDFVINNDGGVSIYPASKSIRSLKGILSSRVRISRPISLEEMDAAIAEGVSGEVR